MADTTADGILPRLRARLDDSAFRARYLIASGGQALVGEPDRARELAGTDPEWTLFRLFGLGDEVGLAELSPPDRELVASLAAAGVCALRDGLCSTAGLIVVPALRGLLLTGLPPTHGGSHGASGYLGADSLRLAALLPRAEGRRVLDVGCGCGVQGLLATPGASGAVLTDVDPVSLRIAAWNAELNSVAHPVELRLGSCYEPVAGERFDLVVSLPPYLPMAPAGSPGSPGSPVTIVAAGGDDGLGVLLPLLEGAPRVLSDEGELHLFAQLLCDDDGPLLLGRLGAVAQDLCVEVFCSERHPLRPFVVEIAKRAASGGPDSADLAATWLGSLRSLGATAVCMAMIRARPGAAPGLRLDAARGSVRATSVLRHAGTLVTGAPWRTVGVDGGTLRPLDDLAVALVSAIDGERDLSAAARTAWGDHGDLDRRDVDDTATWRALELVTLGLVEAGAADDVAAFTPFDDEDVAILAGVQASGAGAYRCASGDGGTLEAERDGWRCPQCGARQTWARSSDLD